MSRAASLRSGLSRSRFIALCASVVALLLVVAACGGDDDDGPVSLEDSSWQILTLGSDTPPAEDAPAFISFDAEGTTGGTTGCNNFTGPYETDGDSITIGPLAVTQALCPSEEIQQQEQAFLAGLENASSYEIAEETLTLRDGSDEILATFARSTQTVAGTWEVLSYNNGTGIISVLAETSITAEFGEDQSLTGSSGCNTYAGTYEIGGDEIEIGGLSMTEIGCETPDGVMEQETQFLDALQSAQTWSLLGDQLELRNRDDQIAVTMRLQ